MFKFLSGLLAAAVLATSSFAAINPNQLQSFASPLMQLSATVSGNVLTVAIPATNLQFKNGTLNGAPVWAYTPALTVVTPASGATLGSTSAVSTRYAAVVQYNAGTPKLCIINLGGGINLDETGTIASTTIGGTSTSAATCYATTGAGASTYRVVGYFDATEATAGTWATAPSMVQGIGGISSSNINGFGVGQTQYANGAGITRSLSAVYYNTTGKTIDVQVSGSVSTGPATILATVNGISFYGSYVPGAAQSAYVGFIVLPNQSYSVSMSGGTGQSLNNWVETR